MASPHPIPVPAADILPTAAQVRYRIHVRRVELDFLRKLLRLLQAAEDQARGEAGAPRLVTFPGITVAAGAEAGAQ